MVTNGPIPNCDAKAAIRDDGFTPIHAVRCALNSGPLTVVQLRMAACRRCGRLDSLQHIDQRRRADHEDP